MRRSWIHYLAGLLGGAVLGYGVAGFGTGNLTVRSSVLAVLGFLIVGWAILDYRCFRRGTAESELDGGHTIE